MPHLKAISLFSNCGAGDVGYRRAGFRFVVMAELDERRLEVCLLNHLGAVGVPGDLRTTYTEVIAKYRESEGDACPDMVAACPPCQGMSSARGGRGSSDDADAGSRDERNLLVVVIAQVAAALRPKTIVVENVPAFLRRKVRHPETGEAISAAKLLVSTLQTDYEVFPISTDLCDYGVPQTRKRSFLTFVRRDLPGLKRLLAENRAPYPRPTHAPDYGGEGPVKLADALRSFRLPSLDAASEETAADPTRALHAVPVWKDRRYEMVAAIPANSGGSAWHNDVCGECGAVSADRREAICSACGEPLLRPVVRGKDGTHRLVTGFGSSYRRMYPDKPAATVTTASGHFGSDFTVHPSENRLLSTLECSLLQTIPPRFRWGNALENWGHTNVRSMIGEAVPPMFTELHGRVLRGVLTSRWKVAPITSSDERCRSARRKLDARNRAIDAPRDGDEEAGDA